MRRRSPGTYVEVATAGERFRAFVPAALPPQPPVHWSATLRRRFDDALLALGRLDALSAHLPNASLLLYSFVRKEAVLSSQIEGTQSSLAHLLLYEIDEQPCQRRTGLRFARTDVQYWSAGSGGAGLAAARCPTRAAATCLPQAGQQGTRVPDLAENSAAARRTRAASVERRD